MDKIKISDISVIIPYYKAAETIKLTIKNLFSSDFRQSQILVVDDCSEDGMVDKLKFEFKNIRIIKNRNNLGASYSRNLGIKKSNSKYILFVDSDIYFEKQELFKLFNNSKYDVIFPKIKFEDNTIMSPNNLFEENNCMCSAVFLIKRESLKKLDELFDINYMIYGEDGDFFLRCKALGLKFKYISNSIFRHPKRSSFSEKNFYLRTKNVIYFSIKLGGLIKYRIPIITYAFMFTFYNFAIALLNRHIEISNLKIKPKIKYSRKLFPRIRLLYLFVLAILWNIKIAPETLKKRAAFKKLKEPRQK